MCKVHGPAHADNQILGYEWKLILKGRRFAKQFYSCNICRKLARKVFILTCCHPKGLWTVQFRAPSIKKTQTHIPSYNSTQKDTDDPNDYNYLQTSPIYCYFCLSNSIKDSDNYCLLTNHKNPTYEPSNLLQQTIDSLPVVCPNSFPPHNHRSLPFICFFSRGAQHGPDAQTTGRRRTGSVRMARVTQRIR